MTRHPSYRTTYEHLLLVDGAPCPRCSSPVFLHHMMDLHHPDAAGR